MSPRIDLLLDVLRSHPEQLDRICEELRTALKENNNRNNFIADVAHILRVGFTSGPVSIYAKLLKQLAGTQINISATNAIYSFDHALNSCCCQPLEHSSRGLAVFRVKLPLMNALFKTGLIKWNILKVLITGLSKNTDITIRYLCEIVWNVVFLYDNKVIDDKPADMEYWGSIVVRLRKQNYESGTIYGQEAVADMVNLFRFLREKRRWVEECTPRDKRKQFSSAVLPERSSECERNSDASSRPTPWDFLHRLPISSQESRIDGGEGSFSEVVERSHPPRINKGRCLELLFSRRQVERFRQEQRPLDQPSQQSAISKVITSLGTNPEYLNTAISDIRIILSKKDSVQSFIADVQDILRAAFAVQSQESFSSCIKLLDNLRDLQIQPANVQIPITFSFAVSKCVCITTEVKTKDEVDAFCSSFRLVNELFKLKMVPSTVFNTYVQEMASGGDDISAAILFKIVSNFWTLVEGGFTVLSEEDGQFWQRCSQKLAFLVDRKAFGTDFADVLLLLKIIETKGGWHRNPSPAILSTTSVDSQNTGAISLGQVDPLANFCCEDCQHSCNELQTTVKMERTESDDKGQEFSLTDGVLLTEWYSTVTMRLRSISGSFEFAKIVGKTLVKIFMQIDNESTLSEASNVCQKLSSEEYGRGKEFGLEMKQFCLKYLSGKEQSDRNKLADASNLGHAMGTGSITWDNEAHIARRLALESEFKKRRNGCVKLVGRLFMEKIVDLPYAMSFVDSLMTIQTEEYFECLLAFLKDVGKMLVVRISQTGQEEWFKKLFEELRKLSKEDATSTQNKKLISEIIALKKCWPHVDARLIARLRLTELLASLNLGVDHASTMNRVRELLEHESPNKHVGGLFELLVERIELYLTERPASVSHASGDTSCSGTPLPDLPPVMQISDMDAQLLSTGKRSHAGIQSDLEESPALKKIASSQ